MDLASHQRMMLGLMRSNCQVGPDDDAYFHRVASSKDLQEARTTVFFWRLYIVERTCALTVALLRQRQLLAPALQRFIQRINISPFREYQPRAFLASLSDHPDPLVVSVSQFELALMKIREGDTASYVVPWHVEPSEVLMCLAQNELVEANLSPGAYTTRIFGNLPFQFEIQPA